MILSDTACFYTNKLLDISRNLYGSETSQLATPFNLILANAGWRYLDVASLTTSCSYTPITVKLWACLGYTLKTLKPLQSTTFQVISRQSSDSGVNPPGSQLLCTDSLSNMGCLRRSKNLAREEYHGTFRVIFDDFLEPGKWHEMARAKSSIQLTTISRQFTIRWNMLELTLNSSEQHRTAPFIVFFDSPTQHFCLWESIWADKLWQLHTASMMLHRFSNVWQFKHV